MVRVRVRVGIRIRVRVRVRVMVMVMVVVSTRIRFAIDLSHAWQCKKESKTSQRCEARSVSSFK